MGTGLAQVGLADALSVPLETRVRRYSEQEHLQSNHTIHVLYACYIFKQSIFVHNELERTEYNFAENVPLPTNGLIH